MIAINDFAKNKLNSLMLTASEPLLYKKIDKVLDRAKKAEIMDVFLFTNGTLLWYCLNSPSAFSLLTPSSACNLFFPIP